MKLPSLNSSGFGIIEVMVAAGLLSVISIGTMTLIGNTTKSQRGIEGKSRQQELRTEIGFLMNEPQACLNTMTGVNVTTPSTALTSIKDGSAAPGVDRYISGSNDGSGLIRYSSFNVGNWVVSPSNVNKGTMDLTITVDKLGEVIGPKVLVFRIPLFVRKDAVTNLVLECYTLSGAMGGDSFWEASPTVPDAIFYNTGNVGIGNDAANFGLSVLKDNGAGYAAMFARDNASNGIGLGTSGTQAMIQGLTSAGASADLTLNPSGGNVGIGTNAAPTAKLSVTVPSEGQVGLRMMSGGNAYLDISPTNIGGGWQTNLNTVNNRNLILNPGTGNVGIGTTNPLTKLHNYGTSIGSFTGAGRGILSVDAPYVANQWNNIDFGYNNTAAAIARVGARVTPGGTYLSLGTSNNYATGITNQAMTIDPTGNVGIGTATTPSNHLQIGGTSGILHMGAKNWIDLGATSAGIVVDNNAYKALMIIGNNVAGNSGLGREVKIWDFLNVQGNARVNGTLWVAPGYIYGRLNCQNFAGPVTNVSVATCPANWFMTSGGGYCYQNNPHTNGHNFLIESYPLNNNQWQADCHGDNNNGAASQAARAWVICCQYQ